MVDVINASVDFKNKVLPYEVANSLNDSFMWCGIKFTSSLEKCHVADKPSIQKNNLGNLYLKFGRGKYAKFYLSNSLHKVCYEGVNYTDFAKSQLLDTINYLDTFFGIKSDEFVLHGRIEFSVNIAVGNASSLIESFTMYKNIKTDNMKGGSTIYGKKADLTKYSVKIYNTMQKHKLENPDHFKADKLTDDNNLLRFEISVQIGYVQKNWGIPLRTFKDFENEAILTAIGAKMVEVAKELFFEPTFPIDENVQDLQKYYYFESTTKAHLKYFRTTKESTYERHKKIHSRLKKQYGKLFNIADAVREKWQFLQSN